MKLVDDRLLEYLEQYETGSPSQIAAHEDFRFGRDYVNRRLLLLDKAGLVQNIGNGVYSITREGQEYLAGTRDLRDLEKPD